MGSRKGGINEQIINTAKRDPGKFWALNNGITLVADTIQPDENSDGSASVTMTRFSIVNGCQTTSSLVHAKADKKAKVLTRIIAAKAAMRSDIVRFNNSQNAVRIWSVRSADNLQQALRKTFKAHGIEYAPKKEGSRSKRDLSIIELDKVAQYLASTHNELLIQAIANKGALFDQPYQKIFPKTITAEQVYLSWLAGNLAEEARQELQTQIDDDENSGLLGVTSSYWIQYCSYKLIDRFTDANSPHIKLDKMKREEFTNALRKYSDLAATMYYEAAVDTYDREDHGSFKSTLRSAKFLQKLESKLRVRITKLPAKRLPDLAATAKGLK